MDGQWRPCQSTVKITQQFGGLQFVLDWSKDGRNLARRQGVSAWGHLGIMVSQMRSLPTALYLAELFDSNASAIIPKDPSNLLAIWTFCSSPEFNEAVRRIDKSLKVTNSALAKVQFDLDHWQKVAVEQYPDGLPEPYSNDPTQWLFKGYPKDSTAPLQVAVARLLGYCWPQQTEGDGLELFADADGIVPLGAVVGERSAAERLRELLAAAWGGEWSPSVEARLLAEFGFANRTLDDWLRNGFFEQHVSLFHTRPFIWQIWDGRTDGFSVLVNYHKLNGPKLDRLIYSYLGSWISQQRAARDTGVIGADERLVAALELERKLKLIREGEDPYDIYVRWKAPHEQPIGWEPDLNDGVRLNIRPWIEPFSRPANSPLRCKVDVNWGKDPGGSERLNDIHLTLEEKQKARDALKAGGGA